MTLLLTGAGYAQGLKVAGTVTDADGSGTLPGVSVVLKGTSQGTTTDENGAYQVTVPNGQSVLVFSFVGYESQELTVGSRTSIDIALKVEAKALNEVVVVGYGTQKKANLTGAVDQVTNKSA